MCGIAGFIALRATATEPELRGIVQRMGDVLENRGPDGQGIWTDPSCGVALAHRRLSIVDLSPTGSQPMTSGSGRHVIVYNGEAFNFVELRRELEGRGRRFRGHSDTEVVLEACEHWGVEATLGRLIGMFAFALWDRAERRLTLARDRLGIKPLFWGRQGDIVLFASQPKALLEHPGWRADVEPDSVAQFLRFNYVPAPSCIWKDIQKLRPGHLAVIEGDGMARETCWWDLRAIAARGLDDPLEVSDEDAIEMIDQVARDAVRRRLVADVPIGAFLSGGIDSSTVVALMQAQTNRPIKTFTIGFDQKTHDEAPYARAVAAHLGTDHTELYVEPQKLIDVVPSLPTYFDEPFADPSEIPTLMLAGLTRRSLTVALAGDGGDEIFAGYTRYRLAGKIAGSVGSLPHWARAMTADALRRVPCGVYDRAFRLFRPAAQPCLIGDRAHKLAGVIDFWSLDDLYERLVRIWDQPLDIVPSARRDRTAAFDDERVAMAAPQFARRMQLVDQLTYLPDWVLAKTDRATMAVGLEGRVPLLDHRLVELGWQLPAHFLYRDGQSKWLLRRVLQRYVPLRLFERPKRGFEPPVGAWIRGPLREWAEELLSEKRLAADGLLNPAPIRRRFREHIAGLRNWQYPLWGVLMLQAWRARWA